MGGGGWDDTMYKILQDTNSAYTGKLQCCTKVNAPGEECPLPMVQSSKEGGELQLQSECVMPEYLGEVSILLLF